MAHLCADRWAALQGLSVSASASRTSIFEREGIVFDASATTDSSTSEPFEDLLYIWDFDDASSGSFSYGRAVSRNWHHGTIAGHIYETAGTYNPTVTVYNGKIHKVYSLPTITVADQDATFATTNTICVSTSGDFTGKPTGASEVTASDFDADIDILVASGKRVLLCGGETFNISAVSTFSSITGAVLGSYGTGRAILNATGAVSMLSFGASLSGFVLQDLEMTGNTGAVAVTTSAGGVTVNRVTINNLYIHDVGTGVKTSGVDVHNEFVMAETVIDNMDGGSGDLCVWGRFTNFAFLGNSCTDTVDAEHVFRLQYSQVGVVQSNDLAEPATTKSAVTIRGVPFDGSGETVLGAGRYTEKLVVSDNKITGSGETNSIIFHLQPSSDSEDHRFRNVIVERNWLVGVASGQQFMANIRVFPGPATFRNNVIDLSGHGAARNGIFLDAEVASNGLTCDDVRIYNNSLVDRTGTGAGRLIWFNETDVRDCVAKNNLGFMVNTVGVVELMVVNSGTSCTASNNTDDTQITGTCPYTDTTPTDPTAGEFDPADYAVGGGTEVAVWDDFTGARRGYGNAARTMDMGALKA